MVFLAKTKKVKKKKRNNVKYSPMIIIIALFCFLLMILRLTQLGLSNKIDGVDLKELASKRTTKTETLTAKRGTIYSADKEVLAQNVTSYKLIAYLSSKRTENKKKPQHVVDKEKTAEALAPILSMTKEEVLKYLNKENVYQTEFGSHGKGLSELTKKKIEALNLPGIDFVESYQRYYPKGNFMSYTLGYAKNQTEVKNGVEKDNIVGEMGLELYYDKILKGKDGYLTYQKDLKGYQIADTKEVRQDAVEGKDIYLTIDSNIQFFVEQALHTATTENSFDWFTVVVAEASTGKILALATNPAFDPNKRDMKSYVDPTVASPYEPGSTMKTFTYMAAMENGVYDGNETYRSGVYVTEDGTEIGDWNRNGWGTISFDRGYALSSNVGIINIISRHMNSVMLRQYFRKLGFGQKTGISLPNEAAGSLNFKYETEVYNAGFGQGITTTPMQNIQALTSLTNDGMLLEPYIVEKIVDPTNGDVVFEGKRKEIERVASTATVEKIKSLMDETVNGIGNTGAGYKMPGYSLIGKTGTAQIASDNGGGYLSGASDIISSFSGIYPKEDPKVIIYASVKRPGGGNQAVIWHAIKSLVVNISKYYGYEPEEEQGEILIEYQLPSYTNQKTEEVKQKLSANGITNIVTIGNGTKVIKQFPAKNEKITNKDRIFLITNENPATIPNLTGLSSKEAEAVLKLLGVKTKKEGKGYVTGQSIGAGTPITEGMEITLTLNPKFNAE